jgi:hypothetical protein
MTAPVLVGAGAFALGGIGPGVFAFVLAGLSTATGARFYRRSRIRLGERFNEEAPEQFRRLWLVTLAAGAIGVAMTFASAGPRAGVAALALWIALVASGAVVLAVTRHRGE